MTGPGALPELQDRPDLRDRPEDWPVSETRILAKGRVSNFVEEDIATPAGEAITRQWTSHPGSVAVMALDDRDRVAVLFQYRHPVATRCWELPAGILDVDGEDPLVGIQRELAEEAELAADEWRILTDWFSSPGGSQEIARIYLATGLHRAPRPEGFNAEGEEVDMGLEWVPFEDLLAAVRAGVIQNPSMVISCLALGYARATGTVDQFRAGDAT